MHSLFRIFRDRKRRKETFYPCRKCVYYVACGDGMRTKPCEDRKTKEEMIAEKGKKNELPQHNER